MWGGVFVVGVFFNFLLILVFIVLPIGAICTQVIPMRLGEVVFHDTDMEHAFDLIVQYAQGTFEQRFGYPTGYFYVDEKRSPEPARILVREAQPAGAITDGCSMELSAMSLSGFEGGCASGCIGAMAIGCIGAPFFLVSAFDRFFRLVLRSRVDIQLQEAGRDTVAQFAFYGLGGYSLRRRYAQVFEKPALPAALAPSIMPPAGRRRATGEAA